jgi:flagellar FliJ protein
MKFKFSLEKVLRHRNLQVDLARRDFLEAQNNLNAAVQVRDDMISTKEQNKKYRSELIAQNGSWQDQVQQINTYLIGQDLRIAKHNESLKFLEKEVESYREILRKALTEAKMMERLKDKKKEEFVKTCNENERKELDEISTLRHARIEKE